MQIPEVIKEIHLDIESFSSVPIKFGQYPYAESARSPGKAHRPEKKHYSSGILKAAAVTKEFDENNGLIMRPSKEYSYLIGLSVTTLSISNPIASRKTPSAITLTLIRGNAP